MKHPWSKDVAKALTQIFKLKAWRRNQLDAINATLSGQHCFVLMPTGGGKSLCYQLPAVVRSGKTSGVTIVVSPLLSLITDQIQSLCDKEIGAAPWTGTMSKQEKVAVTNNLRSKEPLLCLLYVTPESMMQSGELKGILHDLQKRKLIARFVIDEAHCLSQWGHDFRPDYILLGKHLAATFKGIPILALTATANKVVQQDIIKNLQIDNCVQLTQSFNRPNLRYEVRAKTKEAMNDLIRIITADHDGECGIIYCFSKRDCEQVASDLVTRGKVRASHYHAGMSPNDRQRIQQEWQRGVLQVLCATIAFGMGIDKPDVRFVVHYSLPSSLEGYYQETGRAGRDGNISECILFYTYRDFLSIQRMVEQEPNAEQVERRLVNARRVVAFCLNKLDCRRMQVLDYFSETFSPAECKKTCDNCMSGQTVVQQDVTSYVVSAIKLIKRVTESDSITMAQCIDIFRGSKNKRVNIFTNFFSRYPQQMHLTMQLFFLDCRCRLPLAR
ncbi:P-loop containing nucleoside triphosphate hydrolase protein [Melampsora americana]|nr:P-loop containing nucleoside triphosphate hydrolase protein [Melampsora americana]